MRLVFAIAAALGLFGTLSAGPAAAQDQLVWQYDRYLDADPFKTQLTLHYSIPETDAVQFTAECKIGAGGTYAVIEIGADVGNLQDGAAIEVEFVGNRFRQVVGGEVVGTKREEGITGASIPLELDDPLWSGIRGLSELRYSVAGFRPTRLPLRGSSGPTQAFLRDCRDMPGPDDTAAQAAPQSAPAQAATPLPTFDQPAAPPPPAPAAPAPPPAPAAPAPAPPAAAAAAPTNPQAISCAAFGSLRSVDTGQSATVTFINRTDGYRSVMWIDQNGTPQPYHNLNPGEAYTQQTYAGHPWMITDGPGNCLEIYIPQPGGSVFDITAPNQDFGGE